MQQRADLEAGEGFMVVGFCSLEDRQFWVHVEGNHREELA